MSLVVIINQYNINEQSGEPRPKRGLLLIILLEPLALLQQGHLHNHRHLRNLCFLRWLINEVCGGVCQSCPLRYCWEIILEAIYLLYCQLKRYRVCWQVGLSGARLAACRNYAVIQERAYSTPYTLLQIFLQTFLFNLCFAFVGIALASSSLVVLNFFGFVNYYAIASLGVTHLIFIFIWARVAIDPEHRVDIYGLPLKVKAKYLPWCFFAVFSMFGPNLEVVIGFILGYLQYMVLKRSIFCLPKSVYKFIELLFPKCARPFLSYISLQTA